MRLLSSTDFALRVLMRLAAEPPGPPTSVEALARELGGLSRNHLHKVVQDLAALGVVRTSRGAGGGVTLAMAAPDIKVGTLIRQLEEDQPIVECFRADHGCCTLQAQCRLRSFLAQAREAFYHSLDAYSVDDCLSMQPILENIVP